MKFFATLVSVCFFVFALVILVVAKTVSGTTYLIIAAARVFKQPKPANAMDTALAKVEMHA